MPRGNPKHSVTLRVDPKLLAAFRDLCGEEGNFSAAVDEGLRLWLSRELRHRKNDPLAQYLGTPAARESAARRAHTSSEPAEGRATKKKSVGRSDGFPKATARRR
jgi:hypothetical protein